MLADALRQEGQEVGAGRTLDWKGRLREKVASMDWTAVERDLSPFLRSYEIPAQFTREYLLEELN